MQSGGLLTILLILVLCSPLRAAAEVRIFDLDHRRAADVAEAIRTVLGDEVKVTAVEQNLIINADPDRLAAAAELIRRLDHPLRMLRIRVAQTRLAATDDAGAAVSGEIQVGTSQVVIGRPDREHRRDRAAGVRRQVGIEAAGRRERHNVEQFLVTLEGNPARISIDRRLPVTERWLLLARRHAHLVEGVRYESLDTGFDVQPELVGNMVQLVIHPYLSFQEPGRSRETRFHELTTKVNVPLGQWVDLGGSLAAQDEVSREILAAGRHRGEEQVSVWVRVELSSEPEAVR